jgi:hypothetical protein
VYSSPAVCRPPEQPATTTKREAVSVGRALFTAGWCRALGK